MFPSGTPRAFPQSLPAESHARRLIGLAVPMKHRVLMTRGRLIGIGAGIIAALMSTLPADAGLSGTRQTHVPVVAADAAAPCHLPVPDARVVALAHIPFEPWQRGHRGIDIEAQTGDEVVAPADATVEYIGFVVDRPVITLRHAGGLRTSLEPVESTLGEGDVVGRGAPIGTVAGQPGHCAPDTCVHWGMRQGDDYVDPLTCVPGFGSVVLLPLPGS